MDDQGYYSDPPAADELRHVPKASRHRFKTLLPVLITVLATTSGAMLLSVSFIPPETLPLCKVSFSGGGRLDVGMLGFCSTPGGGDQDCQRKLGFAVDDTSLSQHQRDALDGGLLMPLTYAFIFVPISGGLAYISILLSAMGHFLKTSCFVFFGEGNVISFAFMTFSGLAGLVAFSLILTFLLYANANLQASALHPQVLTVALSLAGGILAFTAFLLSLIHFNKSYSSGVVGVADISADEVGSQQTETDFWTDGERAERNEQLLRAQEQAEKNALKSIKDADMQQMNAFLSKGHQMPAFEPAVDHPQTPRLTKSRSSANKNNKYSTSWRQPTSRFDDVPLPPAPTPRSARTSARQDIRGRSDDIEEMKDEIRPLDLYKAKTPRKGFEPPPPAPTSSRYSQNTGYLQSIAPSAADLSQMPPAEEARSRANAVFENQKQKHQSIAPSSVYSQT